MKEATLSSKWFVPPLRWSISKLKRQSYLEEFQFTEIISKRTNYYLMIILVKIPRIRIKCLFVVLHESKSFLQICGDLEQHYSYFQPMNDVRGNPGFSVLHKCTFVVQQLGYDTCPDSWDEYLKMSERVSCESTNNFFKV